MQDTLFHNRYRLLRKLGRGSFGEVWRARDEVADIDVAVKIYIALDERGIEDFRQEFKNVHRLNHPNLLRPEHYDVADSRPFLVMQLCNGSVERQIGDMSEEDMWHFIHDVASGLSYLHSHEIIHRDIKPDNILLSTSGEFMISDFGISTRMQSSMRRSSVRQKQDMDIAGTITYMAPELFSKNPLTVKATDIWALGATMYEVLTGDILFLGQGGILQLKGAEIPDLPDTYSHDLRTLITDCLSLDTWDRPTAEELYTYVDAKIKNRPIPMPWRERYQKTAQEKRTSAYDKPSAQSTSRELLNEPIEQKQHNTSFIRRKRIAIWSSISICFLIIGYILISEYERIIDSHRIAVELFDIELASETINSQFASNKLDEIHTYESHWLFNLTDKQSVYTQKEKALEDKLKYNGHDYVDLGLSVKWATCNVGASKPEKYGDYFAWGETNPKNAYTWETYTYSNNSEYSLTKYNGVSTHGIIDHKYILEARDDAATILTNGGGRIPTQEEFDELRTFCNWEWVSLQNNVSGYIITGHNGNKIFLPAAGYCKGKDTLKHNTDGYYWLNAIQTSNPQYAYYMYFQHTYVRENNYRARYYGLPIRPVLDTTTLTIVVNNIPFKMQHVQGGTFNMGGDRPQQVTVSDYYIAETEVTQALWKAVMGTTIQDEYEEYKKQCEGMNIHLRMHGEGDEYPMYYLSWNECQEFITKLNQLTGKQFRLPTEAEWEFAARGGNLSNGYKYAGSNNVDEVAWYNLINTHPVAQKKPNELGLFDMSGNVGEWCSTKHKGYRVIRGGGHKYYSRYNTITNCMYNFPNSDGPGVGFRLVTQ